MTSGVAEKRGKSHPSRYSFANAVSDFMRCIAGSRGIAFFFKCFRDFFMLLYNNMLDDCGYEGDNENTHIRIQFLIIL